MKHFPIFCAALLLSLCPLVVPSYAQQDEKPAQQEEPKPKEQPKPKETKPDHHAQDEAKHAQDQQKQQMKDQEKNQQKQAQEQEKQQKNEAKHQQGQMQHQQSQQAHKQQEDQAKHQQQQQEKQAKDQQKHQQDMARQSQKQQEEQQKQQDKARQQQARASQHDNDHGHYHPAAEHRRIPEDKFRAHFGHEHHFHVGHPVIVDSQPRFQYSGYWFEFANPWPADWSYDDDCYIDYVDDGYYLFDPVHPGVRIALNIVF